MGRLSGFRYRDVVKRLRYTTIPNHPGDLCQATSKTGPAFCIINCYQSLVSRQELFSFLWAFSFQFLAFPPAVARRGRCAIL